MKVLPSLVVVFIMFFSFLTPSHAQQLQNRPVCMPHDQMIDALKNEYNEELTSIGLTSNRLFVIETYVNSMTGSWTIVRTGTNKRSCVLNSGQGWDTIIPYTRMALK